MHGADLSVERETDEQRVCRDKAAPRYCVLAGTAPIEASCAHQITSVSRYTVLRQSEDCMASSTPPRRPGGAPLFKKAFQILSLLEQSPPSNSFELAAKTLIEKSGADQLLKTSGHLYVVDSLKPSSLSFLPQEWFTGLEQGRARWSGCDNWWAGYPLIAYLQMRPDPDGPGQQLSLNCEVGPVAPGELRQDLIRLIKRFALEAKLTRIKFRTDAMNAKTLYSRFLTGGTLPIDRPDDPDLITCRMRALLTDFEPEMKVVTESISQLFDL